MHVRHITSIPEPSYANRGLHPPINIAESALGTALDLTGPHEAATPWLAAVHDSLVRAPVGTHLPSMSSSTTSARSAPQDAPGTAVYRARIIQPQLAALDQLGPDMPARVRARVSPESLAQIDESTRNDWLSARVSDEFAQALLDEIGAEAVVSFYRTLARTISTTPIFDAFAKGALRLFMLSPGGLLKNVPRAWATVSRDVAEIRIERNGTKEQATMVLYDIAPECRIETFALSWQGSCLGVVDLAGREGTVTLDRSKFEDGELRCEVEWTA